MQTEAARGEWFVGAEPTQRRRPRVESARSDAASGRLALGIVLALGLLGAGVLAVAVAVVPSVYTPLF